MHKLSKETLRELFDAVDKAWPNARFDVVYDSVTMGSPEYVEAEIVTLTTGCADYGVPALKITLCAAQLVRKEVETETKTAVSLTLDYCAEIRVPKRNGSTIETKGTHVRTVQSGSARTLIDATNAAILELVALRHKEVAQALYDAFAGVLIHGNEKL